MLNHALKILNVDQIRELDQYTIAHEPISSIALMERAAERCALWVAQHYGPTTPVCIFCGSGNNGGDGLVMARLLSQHGYHVEVVLLDFFSNKSPEYEANRKRLSQCDVTRHHVMKAEDVPELSSDVLLIDAIFGSGLSRPVEGEALKLIAYLNALPNTVISVDVPSGLFCDSNKGNHVEGVVQADHTLSIQLPKLAFLLPSFGEKVGKWHLIPIGLHQRCINETNTPYHLVTPEMITSILRPRSKFSHKGTYGHAMIIAGSYGKTGAAILSSEACLRTGAGLVTALVPECSYVPLQSSVPEVMVMTTGDEHLTGDVDVNGKTVGIGPGISTHEDVVAFLSALLDQCTHPMVLDADALNCVSENKVLLQKIPQNSILTPHPKEFERLAGSSESDTEQLEKLKAFATAHKCYVVLKGAHTATCTPEGVVYFNSTGNAGMASAGSGDVLTGVITSLLAQGYSPEESAVLGVYLHGTAGDLAAEVAPGTPVMARYLLRHLGRALHHIAAR